MNKSDELYWGCMKAIGIVIVIFILTIAGLFLLWRSGAWDGATSPLVPAQASVCPATFDASTIIITQSRQTVICLYDDDQLVREDIQERRR